MSTAGFDARLRKIIAHVGDKERAEIKKAAEILRSGGLVAFPTETVYGLGANALDGVAVAKIYEAKGRPSDNPIIVHVSSLKMAESVAQVNQMARRVIDKFWPGPLSLVLNALPCVPEKTRGGLSTVALRMPGNATALALIQEAGVPVAAPSANRSGRPSPTDARAVADDLGNSVDMILDGGATVVGLESTVLDITGETPLLLRPGGISKEEIERELNVKVLTPLDDLSKKRSPGTRYRHYAPAVPMLLSEHGQNNVVLEISKSGKKWAWIGVSEPAAEPCEKILFDSCEEYAHELFRSLRELEKSGVDIIVAELPCEEGIGLALKDRLKRAAGSV